MALAAWQATITDDRGNVQPFADVEVRLEATGAPLANIYTDRDGTNPAGNPTQADEDGFIRIHAPGGAFRITATKGSFSRVWRYVPIGLSAERDFAEAFLPRGEWDSGTTYDQGELVSHEGFAFVSNDDGNLNNEPVVEGSPPSDPQSDENWTHVGTAGTQGSDGAPGSSDVTGTSTSSVSIGTGSKMWSVAEEDRGWAVGARLRASSDANPTTHFMEGVVTAYSGNSLTISVDLAEGAGSRSDWTFNLAGMQGEDGEGSDDSAIEFVIDGGGATIEAGVKGDLEVPFACTINRVTLLADQAGDIVVDIWKSTYANAPPADGNSITASAPPTLSSAQKSQDSTLSGWTISLNAGDILRFNVDSASIVTRATVSLKVTT